MAGAPGWLRRIVRRGEGPVVISALAVQTAGFATLMIGVSGWTGLGADALHTNGMLIITIAWLAALVTSGLIAIRARYFWSQSSRDRGR